MVGKRVRIFKLAGLLALLLIFVLKISLSEDLTKPVSNSPNLNDRNVKKSVIPDEQRPKVIIEILTHPFNFERRMIQRNGWLSELPSYYTYKYVWFTVTKGNKLKAQGRLTNENLLLFENQFSMLADETDQNDVVDLENGNNFKIISVADFSPNPGKKGASKKLSDKESRVKKMDKEKKKCEGKCLIEQWHERLGHVGEDKIKSVIAWKD